MTKYQGIRKERAPDLGDIVFRSSWERNFARILKLWEKRRKILAWFYEIDRFTFPIKRGTTSDLPDFKIFECTGKHYYLEVKGWMDDKSTTRLKRFAKY